MIEKLAKLDSVPDDFPWLRAQRGCVHFEIDHQANYLVEPTVKTLQVLLDNRDGVPRCLIAESFPSDFSDINSLASQLDLTPIELNSPLNLEPVYIPKPWGQEIWYSGIEARGVSTCNQVPIAWLLDIFGNHLGCTGTPLLLKVLDPLPEANLGDLYFELHEEKTEVYIVTSVDKSAWPDGIGKIRYGFNQQKMDGFTSREAFLSAYRDAVKAYERVRRSIDSGDTGKVADENLLRSKMYDFTAMRDIREGDVITVEPLVPHSLQHGVRVIEFQTAHYERYILSFGQKVLTQDHWDTDAAITMVKTDPSDFSPVPDQELITDFDEFQVRRFTVKPGEELTVQAQGYAMMIGVTGELSAGEVTVAPESAWLLPASSHSTVYQNLKDEPATVLYAIETGKKHAL